MVYLLTLLTTRSLVYFGNLFMSAAVTKTKDAGSIPDTYNV